MWGRVENYGLAGGIVLAGAWPRDCAWLVPGQELGQRVGPDGRPFVVVVSRRPTSYAIGSDPPTNAPRD